MWRILILSLIIILLIIYLQNTKNDVEDFADTSVFNQTTPTITMCPSKTMTYISNDNEQLCCQGDVVANKCNGTILCSLTESKGSVKNCSKYYHDLYIQRAKQFCPKSLPKYFDNRKDNKALVRGCSSAVNADASEGSSKSCKIYNTESEDTANADSCYLMKKQEEIKCPTPESTTSAIPINMWFGSMNLIQCHFMDKSNIPNARACYDNTTLENYLKLYTNFCYKNNDNMNRCLNSGWGKPEDFNNNVRNWARNSLQMCNVAKKYYIEKSITADKVTF